MNIHKSIHFCGNKRVLFVFIITYFCSTAVGQNWISNGLAKLLSREIRNESVNAEVLNTYDRKRTTLKRNRLSFLRDSSTWGTEDDFQTAIQFIYYKNGKQVRERKLNEATRTSCASTDKFAFILHGWRESCDTEWVSKLIDRLTYHRGGCVICIDYSPLAEASYMWLYRSFKVISNIITVKILSMINEGLDVSKGYMFGFSFGGQLASSVGRALSPTYTFKSIDTCDMAGPGFDILSYVDHREAAEHVQCLHSSRDKGTRIYECHQNVRLGNCGFRQPAASSQKYFSNHGLCVQIYINAFDYPFYAVQSKPPLCISLNPAFNVPRGFTIGYNENPDNDVLGELFVPTSLDFPYNFLEKELQILGFH